MRFVSKLALAAMFAAALSLINPAMAGCRRMGFTVNDYGLEGPKRDAQNLLDKHIAEWAAEQGIEKYNIGKKDVSCELYLNLVLFDEHTCTATTTVCWGDSINRNSSQSASTKKPAPIKKEVATKTKSSEAKEEAASEIKAAAADDAKAAEAKSDEKSDETEAAEAETGDESEVETGAIPVPSTAAGAAAAVSPLTGNTATADDNASETETAQSEGEDASAASSAAAAAAEAAAAAAERAASAAERAAKAAERAAAALANVPQPASSTEPASTGSNTSGPTASTNTSPNTGSPVAPAATSP